MKHTNTKRNLLILAALLACAVSGCKTKDPVDVSSLHTTAARETLKEQEPEETAAALLDQETKPDQSSAGLSTELKRETIGKAAIQYPVLSNYKDSSLEQKANALIRSNAMQIASICSDQDITVQAKVETVNLRRITILYTGETADGERLFFSNTIDLETIQNLGLSDFTDPYTIAGYLVSGEYQLREQQGDEAAIRSYLNQPEKTIEYYYSMLQEADFSTDSKDSTEQTLPSVFSYEKQGVIYLALPLPKQLGSYVLIHYSPDNK